jgi:EmrB/QacA subfamily drug resistance transporter
MSIALETAAESAKRPGSAWGALAALSLAMLLSSFGTSVANIALPSLAQAFGATFQEVQWVILAYLLAVTTLIVGVGRLGDILGRKALLLAGILLFTTASIACGLAPTLRLLIAARAAQGIGAAAMMALSMALAAELAPEGKTGRVMGLLGGMSAVGTALGPSLGGLLIAGFGWPSIFLVAAPLGSIAFGLALCHLPLAPAPAPAPKGWASFDKAGTLLLAATLGAYALSMTIGRGNFGALNVALLTLSLTGLILFLFLQARAASPLIDPAVFRRRGLGEGLAMNLLVSTILMATLVVGPFYLSRGLSLGAPAVGSVLSVGPVVAALSGVPAGRAADRFGSRFITVIGLIGITAGCLLLSLLPASLGIFGYVPAAAVLTLGYALFQAANTSAVMIAADPGQRGMVSGLLNLSRNLGLISGASLMGAVFAGAAKTAHIMTAPPEAVAAAMRFTFAVAALLILAALGVAAARIILEPRRPVARAS